MAYAISINAYPDIRIVLDRALASNKGVKLTFKSIEEVMTFKGRVHSFRHLDRKENAKIYEDPDHPMHGRSVYDPLMCKSEKGEPLVVKIIKLEGNEFNVEDLE